MRTFLIDILFIITFLFYISRENKRNSSFAIELEASNCCECCHNTLKTKPINEFDINYFQLNKNNERTLNTFFKEVQQLKSNTSKKEGVAMILSNSNYQGLISTLTCFTENNIEDIFIINDTIYYIPLKDYYPEKYIYTHINKTRKQLKIISTP